MYVPMVAIPLIRVVVTVTMLVVALGAETRAARSSILLPLLLHAFNQGFASLRLCNNLGIIFLYALAWARTFASSSASGIYRYFFKMPKCNQRHSAA